MIDERKTLYLILNQISFQEYVRLFSRWFFLLYYIKGIVMKPIFLLDILQRATNNMQILFDLQTIFILIITVAINVNNGQVFVLFTITIKSFRRAHNGETKLHVSNNIKP